ncbi:guanylate kinase [Calderihabitans maritimus]|uniref:guanylate kinase n=1 Tax=Calderihabitans maritimus TaxID=1246530 RepID=UPI000B50FFAB
MKETCDQGLLIVISGPSGAGKGTLCSALQRKMPNLRYSISATTRPPRKGEIDGVNYYFFSKEEFLKKVEAGEFLEWAEVYGNYYGTLKSEVGKLLKQGADVLLEIDIQGAMQIKKKFPQAVFIFIVPPSLEELRKRIIKRGTDSPEVIEKRLRCAADELSFIDEYDYVVVNDELEKALDKLVAIITAEKCRSRRVRLF